MVWVDRVIGCYSDLLLVDKMYSWVWYFGNNYEIINVNIFFGDMVLILYFYWEVGFDVGIKLVVCLGFWILIFVFWLELISIV